MPSIVDIVLDDAVGAVTDAIGGFLEVRASAGRLDIAER